MTRITVSLDGVLAQFADRLEGLGRQAPAVMAVGLNAGGAVLRAATIEAATQQTGLSKRTMAKAQREHRASSRHLVYGIESQGGDVRLKYFKARETRAGASAAPWNRRRVYDGAFIKGGLFPNRVGLGMGGHVFQRSGLSRLPIEGGRSGLFIPKEMTSGSTASTFAACQPAVLDAVTRAVARKLGI